MKEINFFLKWVKNNKVTVEDDDSRSLVEYASELSKIFQNNEIPILELSNSVLLFRANDLSFIEIKNIEEKVEDSQEEHKDIIKDIE